MSAPFVVVLLSGYESRGYITNVNNNNSNNNYNVNFSDGSNANNINGSTTISATISIRMPCYLA